jgi:hypothetical protein
MEPNGSQHEARTVHVYVASYNTVDATELCIRSMREYARYPFQVTVGDSGSNDGSLPMLMRLKERGWLRLEQTTGRRIHSEWLDEWRASTDSQLAVFVDSDVEFLRPGWLRELVDAATIGGAAMTFTELLPEGVNFVEPVGHVTIRLASRPAPWLMMLDVTKTARLTASFGFAKEETDRVPEGLIGYDVGAMFFRAVKESGLSWTQMPEEYRCRYHHYGGLSWVSLNGSRGLKKWRDQRTVRRHLTTLRTSQERAG